MEEKIVLTIEKLAGLGDGAGMFEGQRIFVPYTLPGDVVQAHIVRQTKEASYAIPSEILTPSPSRAIPPCKHFADCGGCALQHMQPQDYHDFKQQMAREAVRKAGFDNEVAPLMSLPAASRRRTELKIEKGKLGYYAQYSHRLVDIEECKVLEPALEALILALKPELAKVRGLASMHINGVDGGYDIVCAGTNLNHWKPEPHLFSAHQDIMRFSVREGAKLRTIYQKDKVTLTLAGVKVNVPPLAFLQASAQAQEWMTGFVLESVEDAKKILDLFAGIGTYSFPLASKASVTAYEGDASMVHAMKDAAKQHALTDKVTAHQRDLFTRPIASADLGAYDAIVINPPRSGAKEQCIALATSQVKKLVMISCNPATFARDARILKEGGYKLLRLQPVDQFVYSSHLEIMAEFTL